jgi:multidrug/hemolysin transport system ATP-binding protein
VLDKSLTVYDNLLHRASLYGIIGQEFKERLDSLSTLFSLDDIMKRPIGKLSGGQRRKVDVARALIHNPKILILDEPTTGLDPQTRTNLWQVIDNMRKQKNLTVLLTTHYMEEAADADYVVIIDGGKIAAEGTPHDLKDKYSGDYITIYNAVESDIKTLGEKYEVRSDSIRIEVENTKKATELIEKHPELFIDYELSKGKMDSVFLSVTGKNLTEGK